MIAAGGTGGHIYPGLAIANALRERRPGADVTFAATSRGLEADLVGRSGYRVEMVRVEPLRGGSMWKKLKGAFTLPLALADARRLLRRCRPDAVMGVGGYLSGPLLAVAALRRIPTLILEPNVTPGLTNRLLARLVDAAAVAWPETTRHFGSKGFVSGNPVRPEIAAVQPLELNQDGAGPRRLLLFGGSQGARPLNLAMIEALQRLEAHRDRISVTHQTGPSDLDIVRDAYRRHQVVATVEPYVDAMERAYEEADLVISRAGATTCAELAVVGRPAVLVPLPAAGGHQSDNAEAMQRAGAAILLPQAELTGATLASTILKLLDNPRRLEQMAECARTIAKPEATKAIVDRLEALIDQNA